MSLSADRKPGPRELRDLLRHPAREAVSGPGRPSVCLTAVALTQLLTWVKYLGQWPLPAPPGTVRSLPEVMREGLHPKVSTPSFETVKPSSRGSALLQALGLCPGSAWLQLLLGGLKSSVTCGSFPAPLTGDVHGIFLQTPIVLCFFSGWFTPSPRC